MIIARDNEGIVECQEILIDGENPEIPEHLTNEGWLKVTVVDNRPGCTEYEYLREEEYTLDETELTKNYTKLSTNLDTYAAIVSERLKAEYMDDVLWIDDIRHFHQGLEGVDMHGEYSQWIIEINTYWGEARTERNTNKTAFIAATNHAEYAAITYNPTHTVTRENVETPYTNPA